MLSSPTRPAILPSSVSTGGTPRPPALAVDVPETHVRTIAGASPPDHVPRLAHGWTRRSGTPRRVQFTVQKPGVLPRPYAVARTMTSPGTRVLEGTSLSEPSRTTVARGEASSLSASRVRSALYSW